MKTAVIISNMGGPDSLDDVQDYLLNIFCDRDIFDIPLPSVLRDRFVRWFAAKRAPESREIYRQIGGKSPLLGITESQAAALEKALNDDQDDVHVIIGMRYWHPFIEEAWQQAVKARVDRIIVVSLYPFYSVTTSGSLIKIIKRLSARTPDIKVGIIDRFGNNRTFIEAMRRYIVNSVGEREATLLLSTHSIPIKRIKNGDPYQAEVEEAAEKLRSVLPEQIDVHLSFQSKVGPVKWLEPSTPQKLEELAKNGVTELSIYPFGFVADNSETVYEIGILYRDLAEKLGIQKYHRLDALNNDPLFIDMLKKLILQTANDQKLE